MDEEILLPMGTLKRISKLKEVLQTDEVVVMAIENFLYKKHFLIS